MICLVEAKSAMVGGDGDDCGSADCDYTLIRADEGSSAVQYIALRLTRMAAFSFSVVFALYIL